MNILPALISANTATSADCIEKQYTPPLLHGLAATPLCSLLMGALLTWPMYAQSQVDRTKVMRNIDDRSEVLSGRTFAAQPPKAGVPPGIGPGQPADVPGPVVTVRPQGLPPQGVGDSGVSPGGATSPVPPRAFASSVFAAPPPSVPAQAPAPALAAPPALPPAAVIVVVPAPVVVALPTDPTRTPTQGAGLPDVFVGPSNGGQPPAPQVFAAPASTQIPLVSPSIVPQPATLMAAPPPSALLQLPTQNVQPTQGTSASDATRASHSPTGSQTGLSAFSPSTAVGKPAMRSAAALGEILPGTQELSSSMQLPPTVALPIKPALPATVEAKAAAKCQNISIRPDAQRKAVSLVDFTGDKLIVAAVPDSHVNSVFERAGYQKPDLSQPATWCVLPMVARDLLQPAQDASAQDAALLVQAGGSLQLMSRDQWLTYQASIKPAVLVTLANKTALPLKAGSRSSAKAGKPSGKPTFNLLRPTAISGKSSGSSPSS